MIQVDRNKVIIETENGIAGVCTDVTMVIRSARDLLIKEEGEKIADRLLDDAVRLGKASEEEIRKEAEEIMKKTLFGFLFGGGDSSCNVEEDE